MNRPDRIRLGTRRPGKTILMMFYAAVMTTPGCREAEPTVVTPAGGPYVPTEMEQQMLDSVELTPEK